ncbi:MAG TPA: cation transporter [Opitutaceae bacterium]|nr:cation transporter [Opitutaceae bacterium]
MTTESTEHEPIEVEYTKKGRHIEYLSLGWTSLEAIAGIIAGLIAGSIALIGFGADSVIEIASSAILLWRLSDHAPGEQREHTALKLVGVSFLVLAAYVAFESVESLLRHEAPQVSYFGIGFSVACLFVMPLLARAKRRVASQLRSGALEADSRQSSICAYLAGILLGGLALNALLGWWWADPLAALIMVPIMLKEGVAAIRGETCCCD